MMLGLFAMATTAECLYALVKGLVCTVGGNNVTLKKMEKSGSFKVSGMFHGRIKGKQCIDIQMYNIYYNHTYVPYMLYMHMYTKTTCPRGP